MEEGIHDHQGNAGDDNRGVLEQLGQLGPLGGALDIGDHTGLRLALDQDGTEDQLQRLLSGVLQVDHGVKVAVPHAHEVPHGDGGDDGGADGDQDLEKVGHFGGSVNVRRLLEVPGDALVVGAGNNHVPHVEGAGQQDGQGVVQQVEVVDQQVGGDQAAAEEHGDDKDHIEEASAPEIGPGHGVGGQQGDDPAQDGGFDGVEQGVLKAHPDLGVAQHPLIGHQRPLAEIEGHALVLEGDGVDKGRKDDIDNGKNNGSQKQAKDGICHDQEGPVAGGLPGKGAAFFMLHTFSPLSVKCPCRRSFS